MAEKRPEPVKLPEVTAGDLKQVAMQVYAIRKDIDAVRAAIATLAPELGVLIETLRKSPRTAWPGICQLSRGARGRGARR